MADVEKAEPEYVPADYVAPADAAEQTKGGSRWAPVCDWPLAFREVLDVTDVAAQFPLDKWPGFLEMVGRSLAGLLLVALFFLALIDSGSRLVVLKAVLG